MQSHAYIEPTPVGYPNAPIDLSEAGHCVMLSTANRYACQLFGFSDKFQPGYQIAARLRRKALRRFVINAEPLYSENSGFYASLTRI